MTMIWMMAVMRIQTFVRMTMMIRLMTMMTMTIILRKLGGLVFRADPGPLEPSAQPHFYRFIAPFYKFVFQISFFGVTS